MQTIFQKQDHPDIKYTGFVDTKEKKSWGLVNPNIIYNPSVREIYEYGINNDAPCEINTYPNSINSTGCLCAYSGLGTGRSPKEKRIVKDEITEKDFWWKEDEKHISDNVPITAETNDFCRKLAVSYLNTKPQLYVVDGYIGWDPEFQLKVRCVLSRAYHALFMRNMMIVPTEEQLRKDFIDDSKIDFHLFNAGEFQVPVPYPIKGSNINKPVTVQANFKERTYTIIGSQYAGEMKKGLFTIMHYIMPKRHGLSLHCSATVGMDAQKKAHWDDVTLFFGLSGTGKTTLSADPKRYMLGDDEHVWSKNGVANIEGGCYAKCIKLSRENEPDIYNAIKYGCCLENVVFKDHKNWEVDFDDASLTENTRASYPLCHIPNAMFPSRAGQPKNIVFLTCDAYGVLPPVSRLTPNQAMYQFISGYTAKVAGTEVGITDPVPSFSACFGSAFLALHPAVYCEMLKEFMLKHGTKAWLVNTGWSAGKASGKGKLGKRMSIKATRSIVDSINEFTLEKCEFENFPYFNMEIPKTFPNDNFDKKILNPRNVWEDKEDYDATLKNVAKLFIENFKKYEDKSSDDIKSANPKL